MLMQVKQLLQKVYYIKVGRLIKLEELIMLQRQRIRWNLKEIGE